MVMCFGDFFFFQAEDGIRDDLVTGVQTCALPIWGLDNRTCALRVVGHGPSRRVECRVAGADVNPYLALSALIAGGLHGIDHELALEPAYEGNAYVSDKPRVPA